VAALSTYPIRQISVSHKEELLQEPQTNINKLELVSNVQTGLKVSRGECSGTNHFERQYSNDEGTSWHNLDGGSWLELRNDELFLGYNTVPANDLTIHWIGLQENLQESPIFHGENHGFL
jgi:hypothetical protein